jgi:MFS family permease
MASLTIWVLMGVYAKTYFGLPESAYGLIPTTNAIMVVLFQVGVTKITKRYSPLVALAVGATMYAIGAASVAFAHNFWGFWLAMVIATIGELIMVPISNSYAANLAPTDMRGRYMSVYGLTFGAAMGIAPVMGGWINDNVGPRYTWYEAGIVGLLSTMFFLFIYQRYPHKEENTAEMTPGD